MGNLNYEKYFVLCSFLGSRSSSSDHSQTSVGNASISQTMDGETSSIWMGGKDWGSYSRSGSSYKRSGSRNDMDRGGSLFGSQTSSSSLIESSLESSFGSRDIFSIVQVG